MKKRRDFHLLKLVFKALCSDACPSYVKINEVVRLLRSKCCKKTSYSTREGQLLKLFKIALHSFWIVFLFTLKIKLILITSVGPHTLFFKIVLSN